MDMIARTSKQLGAAIRRHRKQAGLSQGELGTRIGLRQATVSKLEAGEPGVRLQTILDALTALDLELVVRPRSKVTTATLEDILS